MKRVFGFFLGLMTLLCFTGGVSASGLPQANMTVSPAMGRVSSEFTLDARQTRNSAGNIGGVEIRYQLSGSENWTPWTRTLIQKFTPMDTGEMRVYLQVRDIQTKQVQSTYRTIKVLSSWVRRAWISTEETVVEVGQPIDFELNLVLQAYDNKEDVEVRWDFDSDGDWDTGFSRQKFITHVYDRAMTTTPTAEVRFFDDEILTIRGLAARWEPGRRMTDAPSTWDKIKVILPTVTAPVVEVLPGRTGFNESTLFILDAADARVPRGGWIEWSFDGQQWLRFPGDQVVKHRFASPGKHEVRTRVCVQFSNPRCEETTTQIEVERDPIDYQVAITFQNRTNAQATMLRNAQQYTIVEVGDRIRFVAQLRDSYGAGSPYYYRWDFNNDGVWDTHFSTQNYTEHVFDRGGEFVVRTEVRNQDDVMASAVRKIFVDINEKPVAEIGISKEEIYVGESVRFFPVYPQKWTIDWNRTQTRFDLDEDGIWESDFQNVSGRSITYLTPGKKTIVMQLRDVGKNVTTVRKTIEVLPLPEVAARVVVSHRTVRVGETVTFDAARSEGRGRKFFWNFEAQDTVTTPRQSFFSFTHSSSSQISYRWNTAGEKIVSLLVMDVQGKVDQVEFPITVVE